MNYKTLFTDLRAKELDKRIELLAINVFLAKEELHPLDRAEIEYHRLEVRKELLELELRYDFYYKLAVESGRW